MLEQPLPMRPGAKLPIEWDLAALNWLPAGETISGTPTVTPGPGMTRLQVAVVGGRVVALVEMLAGLALGTQTYVDCEWVTTPSGFKDGRRFRLVAEILPRG